MNKRTDDAKTEAAPKNDQVWFERKVAELKAELEKLPPDRQEQLKRELKCKADKRTHREIRDGANLEAAADHIAYEIETMAFAASSLEWGYSSPAEVPEGKEKDVFLEAFLLHYRNLRDFLCPGRRDALKDDVLASDYFGAETQRDLADLAVLGRDRVRMNKLLAHISYDRIQYERAGKKEWLVQQMLRDILNALGHFIRALPEVRQSWFLKSERVRDALAFHDGIATQRISEPTFTTTVPVTSVTEVRSQPKKPNTKGGA